MPPTNKTNRNFVPHPMYGANVMDSGGQLAEAEIRAGFWAYRDAILFPQSALVADTSKQHYCLFPRKYYVDIAKVCRDCQRPFLFFAKEQQHWFETLGFYVDADCVRCTDCRRVKQQLQQCVQRYEQRMQAPQLLLCELDALLQDTAYLVHRGHLKNLQKVAVLKNSAKLQLAQAADAAPTAGFNALLLALKAAKKDELKRSQH